MFLKRKIHFKHLKASGFCLQGQYNLDNSSNINFTLMPYLSGLHRWEGLTIQWNKGTDIILILLETRLRSMFLIESNVTALLLFTQRISLHFYTKSLKEQEE